VDATLAVVRGVAEAVVAVADGEHGHPAVVGG